MLPVSVNDASNGLLLCPTCHAYFDSKHSLLQIGGTGKIIVASKLKNYKNLLNALVPWASYIGKHKDYPTKELLEFAQRLKPAPKKRLRELIEESEERMEEVQCRRVRRK